MRDRKEFISVGHYGWHKGFYNDEDFTKALIDVSYTDFFEYPDDEEFPYDSAYSLLCGSCHHFALSLQKGACGTTSMPEKSLQVSMNSWRLPRRL